MIDLILGALCEFRSDYHASQHGGRLADSAWHVAHGELPTCEPKNEGSFDYDQDDDWDRDRFGFGCTWRGCG